MQVELGQNMGRAAGSERVDKQVKGTGNGFELKSDGSYSMVTGS